jgi:superfamily I DNA/RNA helicase
MEIEIIFGPPGTGKTTTLQDILTKELEEGTDIRRIAYVSYTREGTYQGKARAKEKFGLIDQDMPWFRTLHSIAFNHLKMRRSDMLAPPSELYRQFSEKMGMKFTGYYTEDFRHNDDRYLFFDILHRNNPKTANNYLHDLDIKKLRFVQQNYKQFKEYFQIYDFTDLIQLFNKDNNELPVDVAFIDEAQDLTTLQWQMIWIAFRNCKRIYIAGDDDQAIYEWSGADVNYFLGLQGKQTILRHSYRLPKRILRYSKKISHLIEHRVDKEYTGIDDEGEVVLINNIAELNLDTKESWLFLSRNHWFLRDIMAYLKSTAHIYMHRKELSVSTRKVEAINLFEKIRKTRKSITEEMKSITKHLIDGKANFSQPWYMNFNWDVEEIMYYRDLVGKKVDLGKCNISVDTIHSVKGSEADNVVLLSDITKQVLENVQNNPDSERRVFYVGATRAKKRLYIVSPTNRYEFPLRSFL